MRIREVSVGLSKKIEDLLFPCALSCTTFFIALGILIPPTANWVMAAIVTAFSSAPILIFCVLGDYVLRKIGDLHSWKIYSAGLCLGIAFGYIGYILANLIAYFQSTEIAFLAAGVVASISVSFKITANRVAGGL